ncbi:glycosyl transferase [Bacteroidia bacterium]|nr:glycosyl transferase [Bacteroidia bacterium]
MPAYNTEKCIAESIESILKQSFNDFELIIVGEESTDNTLSIIHSFSDKRIILLQNEHDFIGSLNLGLQKATGKYIACMDANDMMHIDRLKIQHTIMEEESDITVCGTWMIPFGDTVSAGKISQGGNGLIENPLIQLLKGNFIFHPTEMIRKDFLDSHNLQYQNYLSAEDYQLWFEIAKRNGMFYIESQPLLYYRVSETRINIERQKEQQETSLQIKQEMLEYLIDQNKEKHSEIATLYGSFLPLKEQNWLTPDDIFAFFYTFFLKNKLKLDL